MKIIITMLAVMAMGFNTWAGGGTMKVDTEASSVAWTATKVGGSHAGLVSIQDGSLTFEGHALTGGEFTINMKSINVTDIENEKSNAKLAGHLHSPDFFNTEEFPTATLKITNVENTGNHAFSVTGDLTIKGITEAITFDAKVGHAGSKMTASANLVVDRSKFDVRYGSTSFFDNLGNRYIHDLFTLGVSLVTAAE